MKRILWAVLAAAMLASLTVGQESCPEQGRTRQYKKGAGYMAKEERVGVTMEVWR